MRWAKAVGVEVVGAAFEPTAEISAEVVDRTSTAGAREAIGPISVEVTGPISAEGAPVDRLAGAETSAPAVARLEGDAASDPVPQKLAWGEWSSSSAAPTPTAMA